MVLRKQSLVGGQYYHIYSRGNNKQKIFLDDKDYITFIKCIFVCNMYKKVKFRNDIVRQNINAFDFNRGDRLVSIGAWVLMPNHFHLYLTINPHKSDLCEMCKDGKNEITEFLRKVLTSYVKYFNKKYGRTGSLFESKFKSVHIDNNNQAKYLFSYIHLNPIKLINSKWKEDGIKDKNKSLEFLNKYKWSSYLDFTGVYRDEGKILNLENFPNYFKNIKDFNKEILEWLSYK